MLFPSEFLWGAATSAYQIEGGTGVDGRGESIWDRFCATPGKVLNGETGDPACDHYARWSEDVDLMADLGLQAYRFSISWPRVMPDGVTVNQRGLDFYRRLVERLQENAIRPFATLYHWDLPQALQDVGGWESRDVAKRFVDYAAVVFDALGDTIHDWITQNEPWVQGFLGYTEGWKAPGIQSWRSGVHAAHHLLLAHGWAVDAFRSRGATGRIGITVDLTPVSGDPAAARRLDGYRNRWFLEPLFEGRYPEDMVELYEPYTGPLEAVVHNGDLEAISAPIDLLGVNYYHPSRAYPGESDVLRVDQRPRPPLTAMGWEVRPASLVELLLRLKRDYPTLPPIYITENGAAFDDEVVEGRVDDMDRLSYLQGHVYALAEAIEEGVDVRGYFAWSLLDNFEWEEGYGKRFGIVHVDYETQERTVKTSGRWYAQFIAERKSQQTSPV